MYEKFQKLLDKNKCSAYSVSIATGVPYSCLSDWKTGKSKPKIDKLIKIADYFGVEIDYFIER